LSARKSVPRSRPGEDHTLEVVVEKPNVGDTPLTAEPPKSQTPVAPKSKTSRRRPVKDDRPRYLQMLRMEARLRPDQVEALAALRRRINASRVDKSERITDNTLLRVAVDLLIAHGDQLEGDNEDQLRDSASPVIT
jgi:hypothetical protein